MANVMRRVGCWGVLAGSIAAAFAIELWLPVATPLAAGLAVTVLMAATLWASAAWWRKLDEAARDAHKTAWFWGGTVGLAVAGILMVVLMAKGGEGALGFIQRDAGPAVYVVLGTMLCIVPQMLGYAVVWAGWWLAKR
jgi:hypothetical protein